MRLPHLLFLTTAILASSITAHAQDTALKKNEIFIKVNPLAAALLGAYVEPELMIGYKRQFSKVNLRAYVQDKNAKYSTHETFDNYDSSVRSFSSGEEVMGAFAGIEWVSRRGRKPKLYAGADAGISYTDQYSYSYRSALKDSFFTYTTESRRYTGMVFIPFAGLNYNISPRFNAKIEFAPQFSYAKPNNEVIVMKGNISEMGTVPAEEISYGKFSDNSYIEFNLAPVRFWLGFRL